MPGGALPANVQTRLDAAVIGGARSDNRPFARIGSRIARRRQPAGHRSRAILRCRLMPMKSPPYAATA